MLLPDAFVDVAVSAYRLTIIFIHKAIFYVSRLKSSDHSNLSKSV